MVVRMRSLGWISLIKFDYFLKIINNNNNKPDKTCDKKQEYRDTNNDMPRHSLLFFYTCHYIFGH